MATLIAASLLTMLLVGYFVAGILIWRMLTSERQLGRIGPWPYGRALTVVAWPLAWFVDEVRNFNRSRNRQ